MRFKKWLVAVLAVGMALSLAACGGGVDKAPLIEAFNAASTSFDEVGQLVNERA